MSIKCKLLRFKDYFIVILIFNCELYLTKSCHRKDHVHIFCLNLVIYLHKPLLYLIVSECDAFTYTCTLLYYMKNMN